MKFLLDMPVSPSLVAALEARGHTAIHAMDVGLAVATDEEILARARVEGETIITADLDYPRLLALAGSDTPSVILFRGGQYSEGQMRELLDRVLDLLSPDDLQNSMVVVDEGRIRRRRLPM